nr:olfactory receptor 52N4-like [Pelodiscus sinensis]|eukprot:XP_006110290.1 olfactory receptor 52N4-like [Pelodiscus sinensis]
METSNFTGYDPPTFILMGIPGLGDAHIWISIPFAAFYMTALLANFTVLSIVAKEQRLHKPMYLLIGMLAVSDMIIPTTIIPRALGIFWFNLKSITLAACLAQAFFLPVSATMHSGVLMTMAVLVVVGFIRAVLFVLPMPFLVSRMPFCDNRIIPHTYCETMAVSMLSCGDITGCRMYGLVLACVSTGFDMTVIAISYVLITRAVLRMSSKTAHQKALSTCTAHILVILMAYPPGLFSILAYRFGEGITPSVHIILSNLIYLLPSMLNPIVYGIKTKELREEVVAFICRRFLIGITDYKTT